MSKYTTLRGVASKVDWEGGLYETAFGYGLHAEEIDEDTLPELHAAWLEMDEAHRLFLPAFEKVEAMFRDFWTDDDGE